MTREYKDLVQDVSTTAGTAAFVPAGTPPTGCQAFSVHSVGATFDYKAVAGSQWEVGTGTWNGTNIARSPSASSNGNALVNFSTAPTIYEVVNAASVADLLRASDSVVLTDYLAANSAGTAANTDVFPVVRGNSLLGMGTSALAALINRLWSTQVDTEFPVNSTAAFDFDSSVHNRRIVMLRAAPSAINSPSDFSRVGNGFKCTVVNESGADVPLPGVSVRPSGTVLPNGTAARVIASSGTLYAHLYGMASAAAAPVTAPGALTGLAAGTATSTTQPLSWNASSNATGYKVEFKLHTDTNYTVAVGSTAGTSYTVGSGLTAAQSYDYRVTPLNGTAPGTAGTLSSVPTAAAPAGPTLTVATPASPQTVGVAFPVTGNWTGTQPSSLDFLLTDNGTAGAWTQVAAGQNLVINANGTWTFNQTPASPSTGTGRTITVRDHTATTVVSNQTNPFVVNAAAAPTTAPFTIQGHSSSDAFPYQTALRTFDASYWGQTITPTGAATIVSISGALSESNTEVPTSAIDWTKPVGHRGKWIGAIKLYSPGNWLTAPDGTNVNTIGISQQIPTPINIYLWVFLTDSTGVTWKFVYPGTQVGDNVTTAAPAARVTPTPVA